MPAIKGTASVADSRARNKALKKTKFPRNYGKSVSLEKVNKPVLIQWIEQKISSILGFEDEIVSSTAINLFLPSDNSPPDPRKAQLDLVGFLGEHAATFSAELWKLMLEAQASTSGIPRTLLEQKKKEMTEKMAKDNGTQQQIEQSDRVAGNSQNNQDRAVNRSGMNRNHVPVDQNTSEKNATKSQRDKQKGDRKGSPSDTGRQDMDQFGRINPPHRMRNHQRNDSRDRHERNRPYPSEASRHSRYRSRSRERYDYSRERESGNRRRSDRRLDDRRHDSHYHDDRSDYRQRRRQYDDDYYRNERGSRNRYHSYDREMDDLERHLARLKNQYSGRDKRNDRNMHRVDREIRDIEDRIYDLERRRHRYNSSRDEQYRGRSRRDRSPSYEYRRRGRRSRSNSVNSDRSDSMHSGRESYSTDSSKSGRSSRKSHSPSPERNRRGKRQRRRRSRSVSSSEGS